MTAVASADGAHLVLADGRRVIDAISSWWVVTHGHRHPKIIEAIKQQADKLDQVIFAGFTHEPAERLARMLLDVAPPGLAHVFYSDSGSTAVEVAIKMALGASRHLGKARTRIVALDGAYHGDTVGTMSAGARGVFTAAYEPLLFDVQRAPFPQAGHEQATLDQIERECRSGECCALLVEPLVQGAGGMRMYAPGVLRELRRISSFYGVYLIVDEVMTGFGRTGSMFACEQAGISPDILCLAKGLTGGSLPLAATLATADLFDAHLATDRARMFFHSSSYTANPIACAAAVANLEIWRDEPVQARVADLAARQDAALTRVAGGSDKIVNVRRCGTIAAFDVADVTSGYLSNVAMALMPACLERGVLIRPLGNTVYTMPPYCISAEDLAKTYDGITDALQI